jgi:RNA recognition motif-containing protein
MKKLYVGNLPYSAGEDDIAKLFQEYGEVASVNVIIDRSTGQSRGFGFVEMDDADAQAAIDALNEQDFDGRKLVVNEARPPKSGGGGGGRGGRGGGGGRGGRGGGGGGRW